MESARSQRQWHRFSSQRVRLCLRFNPKATSSKLTYEPGGQQVRHRTVAPRQKETVAGIGPVNESDRSAPIVLAAIVEGFE
jgi:hypothetical protein